MNDENAQNELENEQNRLQGIRDDLRTQEEEKDSFQEHSADEGSEQTQREVDLSILEQVESQLEDVEHALRKLGNGEYGKCEVCGTEIPEERLKAQPATRFCAEHAEAMSSTTDTL